LEKSQGKGLFFKRDAVVKSHEHKEKKKTTGFQREKRQPPKGMWEREGKKKTWPRRTATTNPQNTMREKKIHLGGRNKWGGVSLVRVVVRGKMWREGKNRENGVKKKKKGTVRGTEKKAKHMLPNWGLFWGMSGVMGDGYGGREISTRFMGWVKKRVCLRCREGGPMSAWKVYSGSKFREKKGGNSFV